MAQILERADDLRGGEKVSARGLEQGRRGLTLRRLPHSMREAVALPLSAWSRSSSNLALLIGAFPWNILPLISFNLPSVATRGALLPVDPKWSMKNSAGVYRHRLFPSLGNLTLLATAVQSRSRTSRSMRALFLVVSPLGSLPLITVLSRGPTICAYATTKVTLVSGLPLCSWI